MDDRPAPPPVLTEPLTVAVVGGDIVLDGDAAVAVSLTPDAAIETGIRLVNAGIGIDDGASDPAKQS